MSDVREDLNQSKNSFTFVPLVLWRCLLWHVSCFIIGVSAHRSGPSMALRALLVHIVIFIVVVVVVVVVQHFAAH